MNQLTRCYVELLIARAAAQAIHKVPTMPDDLSSLGEEFEDALYGSVEAARRRAVAEERRLALLPPKKLPAARVVGVPWWRRLLRLR